MRSFVRAGETVGERVAPLLAGLPPVGDAWGMSESEIETALASLRRAIDVLEASSAELVAELVSRRRLVPGGPGSVAGFLAGSCGMSSGEARRLVAVSGALGSMPETRALFETGEVSAAKVRVLAPAAFAYPDLFGAHEAAFVDAAKTLTVGRLRKVVAYWRSAVDWDAATIDAEKLHARRYLSVSRTFEGMVKLDGIFDPTDGETILAALAAATTPADRASGSEPEPWRSAPARRADGLVEIARRFLDTGAATVAGERPHVSLVVDLPTLQRLPTPRVGEGRCELGSGTVPPADHARMIACDSALTRVVVGAGSEPLDVGRRTRTIPPAIRRALTVRDGGCRWPGCDRPPDWCDGHHLVHWADGGPTRLDNLILLCRRHHRAAHTGRGIPTGPDG